MLSFGAGLFAFSEGVAVSEATNTVYAVNKAAGSVHVFGAPAELAQALTGTPATGVTGTSADVSGGRPRRRAVTGCRFEYGTTTSYGQSEKCEQTRRCTGPAAIPVTATLAVHPDETYHYRLVAVNANGSDPGEDETFTTQALAPALQSESASALAQTAATLDATIDPNDQETSYRFEYGATTEYGTVLPAPAADIGAGYETVNVGQRLAGLAPGTTYHFRVIASNETGRHDRAGRDVHDAAAAAAARRDGRGLRPLAEHRDADGHDRHAGLTDPVRIRPRHRYGIRHADLRQRRLGGRDADVHDQPDGP